MQIAGLQKTTLVDFPGKVAATIFTRGCTFRCGFCHNPELVLPEEFLPLMDEDEILNFFAKRAGKLQGVCITGGEPTMNKDLPEFIIELKKLGYAVKLDTNGSNPTMLEVLIHSGNLDYVAMDIKGSPSNYLRAAGLSDGHSDPPIGGEESLQPKENPRDPSVTLLPQDDKGENQHDKLLNNIEKSVSLIMNSGIDYEFRTTICHPIHSVEEFKELGELIKGAKRYFIQSFVQSKHNNKMEKYSPFSEEETEKVLKIMTSFVSESSLRA